MKPYPSHGLSVGSRIFNNRARRVSEKAFGVLCNIFRCLLTTLVHHPKNVTMECLVLHNIVVTRYPNYATQSRDLEGANTNYAVTPSNWRGGYDLEKSCDGYLLSFTHSELAVWKVTNYILAKTV